MEVQKLESQFSLTKEIQSIGKVIYHVNQLSAFPVSDSTLISWSKSISDTLPELDIEDLKLVIQLFKIGDLPYDTRAGVQNIFNGLKIKFGAKYFKKKMQY